VNRRNFVAILSMLTFGMVAKAAIPQQAARNTLAFRGELVTVYRGGGREFTVQGGNTLWYVVSGHGKDRISSPAYVHDARQEAEKFAERCVVRDVPYHHGGGVTTWCKTLVDK
jgi:hypothetical protein